MLAVFRFMVISFMVINGKNAETGLCKRREAVLFLDAGK
jgi:hypothetical protein